MSKTSKTRRTLLASIGLAAIGGAGLASFFAPRKGNAVLGFGKKDEKNTDFPYQLSDAEWQEKLSPEAYKVLRKAGTERAGSSPLNNIKEAGIFHCKGCDHPLFDSKAKYESGTGWPSFYEPLNEKAVGTSTDYVLFYPRTEVHCANCGGHLGHVFEDGPEPTGLRYCMNGVAMTFKPA
jgi:peptide-methionine (R)-S-oxide reductase